MPSPKCSRTSVDYERLATELMFGGKLDLQKHGVVYRQGKGRDDVVAAIRKARHPRNGHAKTELELSMLEVYLKDVFKAAPRAAQPVAAGAEA